MRDAIVMWRYPRMVVLTAVCAGVFAATMLPFKALVIFPGLAEVRPASALPIVFSFLFGPAGAWGAAFGNLVGDFLGGMIGPGMIVGFAANFAYGYIPYKLWQRLFSERTGVDEILAWREKMKGEKPWTRIAGIIVAGLMALAASAIVVGHLKELFDAGATVERLFGVSLGSTAVMVITCATLWGLAFVLIGALYPIRFLLVVATACLACAAILGWGIDLLGFLPFRVFGLWILTNNIIVSLLLAPPLLLLLHPLAASRFLIYTDILEREEKPATGSPARALMVILGSAVFFLAGVLISPDLIAGIFGSSSDAVRGLTFLPFVLFLSVGIYLL